MRETACRLVSLILVLGVLSCGAPKGQAPPSEIAPTAVPATPAAAQPSPAASAGTTQQISPSPSAAPGALTPGQRRLALEEATAFVAGLAGADPEADARKLAAYLAARREFEAAGAEEDGSVWARFRDGRLYIVVNDLGSAEEARPFRPGDGPAVVRQPTGLPAPRGILRRAAGRAAAPPEASAGELPASKLAVVVSSLDPIGYAEEEFAIRDMLTDKGYEVQGAPAAVEVLKTVRGAGVFYFDTHGGRGRARDDAKIYALQTRTPVSPQNDEAFDDDLEAGRLVYMGCRSGKCSSYGITESFVSEYMSFSRNSLVYLAACNSADTSIMLGFQYAGASVALGWTQPVSAKCDGRTANTLFDILLGTNRYLGLKPPQRPFDFAAAWEYMTKGGVDACGKARLVPHKLGGNFGLLAPSIKQMEVVEATTPAQWAMTEGEARLTLHGLFGSDPGEEGLITIADRPVRVESWKPDEVKVHLPPAAQSGGAGEVVVRVRGHPSNAVPLTLWHGVLSYAVDETDFNCSGALTQTYDFDLFIRADVHPYREKPGHNPVQLTKVPFSIAQDSSAEFAFGGVRRCCCPCVHTQFGAGKWLALSKREPHGFQFNGSINTQETTLQMTFEVQPLPDDFWAARGGRRETECDIAGERLHGSLPAHDNLGPLGATRSIEIRTLLLDMDDGFNIAPGKLVFEPWEFGFPIQSYLEWQEIRAQFAPQVDTLAASRAPLPG